MKFKVHVEHGDSDCISMTCEAASREELVYTWGGLVRIGSDKHVVILPRDQLRYVGIYAAD